ncbi:Swi3-domain-containing protein [Clavulina sp. PMI_390]|nr:Swi3-domain-containing protein [Clavulina sp. PMI_390]
MDDIWDDSAIVPRSPARVVARPLFVASPSQSPEKPTAASARRVTTSGASTSKAATATAHEAELDEIFADVENLDNANRASKKARRPPRSDSNTGKAKVLLSDDDTDEDDAAIIAAANKKADEKAEEQKKPRKKPVKLDEDRLLGKTGFPALIEQHKKFKPSGKGNEIKDLKRLLQMYQFWAVKMYPRSDFRETATKVEKLCHTKRMIVRSINSFTSKTLIMLGLHRTPSIRIRMI